MTGRRIGDLARRFELSVETIRYYERSGLMPKPARSSGNYRLYTDAHASQLAFILNCRALDMTLQEIKALLVLRQKREQHCGDVNAIIDSHVRQVGRKISDLQRLLTELESLRTACNGTTAVTQCRIFHALDCAKGAHSKPSARSGSSA